VNLQTDRFEAVLDAVVGAQVGRSKEVCTELFLKDHAALPEGSKLDFPQRLGYVEFQDSVLLFVNMPERPGLGNPRSYPNEWLQNGRFLSWFLRDNEWKQGSSHLAKKLLDDATTVILFVRIGKGQFLCCGKCRLEVPKAPDDNDRPEWNLVQLNLELVDYERLLKVPEFRAMAQTREGS
jgi:hypothetical protein